MRSTDIHNGNALPCAVPSVAAAILLTSHFLPLTFMMAAISWGPFRRATWLGIFAVASTWACGGRAASAPEPEEGPVAPRVLPLSRVFILETSGPPPSDTSVTFTTGTHRMIVLYHSGESIAFARLTFEANAFGDSGRTVQVDVRPRPGIYGLDLVSSLPFRSGAAAVTFVYGRYFSAPARARQVYGNDVAFERALAVGHLLSEPQVELLPPTRPAPDNLSAAMPAPGGYIVAAPQ